MKSSRPVDHGKTLDDLEGQVWGDPSYDSYLVQTIHRLRKKRIGEFTVEDLRIMIGQGIGLPWLIPLALEVLEERPLASGDLYPGDLLASLLRIEPTFWDGEWGRRLRAVVGRLDHVPKELEEFIGIFRGTG